MSLFMLMTLVISSKKPLALARGSSHFRDLREGHNMFERDLNITVDKVHNFLVPLIDKNIVSNYKTENKYIEFKNDGSNYFVITKLGEKGGLLGIELIDNDNKRYFNENILKELLKYFIEKGLLTSFIKSMFPEKSNKYLLNKEKSILSLLTGNSYSVLSLI